MIYRIFQPNPALSDVVEHYWYAKADLTVSVVQQYATPLLQGLTFNFSRRVEHHTFNDETMSLDKSAYIFGQSLSPRTVNTSEKGIDIIGVKFRPLGITKVTGINMEHLADKIIDAEDIWGSELETLCDSMQSAGSLEKTIHVLETFLLRKRLNTPLHYRVDNARDALKLISEAHGNIDIKELREQTNTSRKTLERIFTHYLGVHPKLYARIVRFNAVKERMDTNSGKENLTAVALRYGFYDSSHFISEFKKFSGTTPHAYLKNKR